MNETSGRPAYETKQDIENEKMAADRIIKAWPSEILIKKLPAQVFCVDWALHDAKTKELLCFAEYRKRDMSFGQYPDFRFCLNKWRKLRQLASVGKAGLSLFVLETSDGKLYGLRVRERDTTPPVYLWGRENQRDEFDELPCVAIDWDRFGELKEAF